jgi:hypothetical protein
MVYVTYFLYEQVSPFLRWQAQPVDLRPNESHLYK